MNVKMTECGQWVDDALRKIRHKMEWVSEKNRKKIPYTTDRQGNYDDKSDAAAKKRPSDGLCWWTNGFWGGMMWLLYQDTGKESYAEVARISEKKLEQCLTEYYGLHHDVGFMYMPTAIANYRLTGNETSRKNGLHAANLLAGRFNPIGKYIRAWNDHEKDTRGWAIIDCMFNLSLLYWAYEETNDPRFLHIGTMHADTVMKNFVRENGSVCHIVEFDSWTGEMVRSHGGQGYGEGSSWTRGQGWALYGFMISYLHTGKQEYLETAKRVADHCVAHMPESGLIPIDFMQPAEPALEDSCGACIIAGGLLELAKALPETERGKYEQAAIKILRTIDEKRANYGEDCDAIVQNCSGAYHSPEHHVTMNYADYYYIEALYKLKGIGRFMW